MWFKEKPNERCWVCDVHSRKVVGNDWPVNATWKHGLKTAPTEFLGDWTHE